MSNTISGYDYTLSAELTIDLKPGCTKYIKVDGRYNGTVMGTKILDAGAIGTVSVALESWLAVVSSGYQDSEVMWTDYQSPTSGSIVTISGNLLWKTLSPAPNIIKISNTTASGTKRMRFNFRGSF